VAANILFRQGGGRVSFFGGLGVGAGNVQVLGGADVRVGERLIAFVVARATTETSTKSVEAGLRVVLKRMGPDAVPRIVTVDRPAAETATGRVVRVESFDGAWWKGPLVSLSATDVTLRQSPDDLTIALNRVKRVVAASHAIRNDFLIGLLAGLVLGEVSHECYESYCYAVLGAVGAGIGAGVGLAAGVAIDGATERSRTLYAAPPRTTFSLVPVVDRRRAGIGGVVSW
jgi:hypothetical protein